MTNKYDRFEEILLEDTGLITKNSKDSVYNRLSKNSISNLKELFIAYDSNEIYYGPKVNLTNKHGFLQTKGIVKLLRAYYLDEDLEYDHIMNGTLNDLDIRVDSNNYNFIDVLLSMGLTFNFSISIRDCKNNNGKKIIDILEDVYEGKIKIICTTPEYEKNIRILGILLKCYYKKNEKIESIDDLNKLRDIVINLKNIKDKKQEYILAKIELNRLIFEKTNTLNKELIKLKKISDEINN